MQHPFSYPLIVLVWCRSPYILLPRLYFRNARSVSLLPGHSNRQIKEKEKKIIKTKTKIYRYLSGMGGTGGIVEPERLMLIGGANAIPGFC